MKYSLDELKAMIPINLNGSLPESEAKRWKRDCGAIPSLKPN